MFYKGKLFAAHYLNELKACIQHSREIQTNAPTKSSFPFCPQVFVEYANSSDCKEAQRLLTGRTFDGKFVVATFYPLSAYKRGYLYQTVQWTFKSSIYTSA